MRLNRFCLEFRAWTTGTISALSLRRVRLRMATP